MNNNRYGGYYCAKNITTAMLAGKINELIFHNCDVGGKFRDFVWTKRELINRWRSQNIIYNHS